MFAYLDLCSVGQSSTSWSSTPRMAGSLFVTQVVAINAILVAARYNFRLLLTWLRLLSCLILSAILSRSHVTGRLQIARETTVYWTKARMR